MRKGTLKTWSVFGLGVATMGCALVACSSDDSVVTVDGGADAPTTDAPAPVHEAGKDASPHDAAKDSSNHDAAKDSSGHDSAKDAPTKDAGDDSTSSDGGGDSSSFDGGGDSSSNDGGVDAPADGIAPDTGPETGTNPDGATNDGSGDAPIAACDTPTTGIFYVDPVNGSDLTDGSGTAGGTVAGRCAFKTLTHALTTAGSPSAATVIHVLGSSTVSDGETFPLVVPANVIIDSVNGAVTVALPANSTTNAFSLSGAASGLKGLIIDGSAAAASTSGVVVDSGATITTFVKGVEVSGFGGPGIEVEGTAAFTIAAGTKVHDNGAATSGTAPKSGLYVTGTATVTANVGAGSLEVSFGHNAGEGVLVDSNASIAFTGVAGTSGEGTIVAHDNATNGITITATPATVNGAGSTLTGVVLWENGAEGAEFAGGSTVVVRSSVALKNGDNGILISAGTAAVLATNPIANIDLGSSHDGMNLLQATTDGNGAVGICNAASGNSVVTAALKAEGNTFNGKDCSQSSSASTTLNSNKCVSGSGVALGIKQTTASIDTAYCTN